MTTIIGLVDNGTVYIGGDAQLTAGYERTTLAQPKAIRSGLFAYGSTGTWRFSNLIQHAFDIPTDTEDKYDMRYMVRVFVPTLREMLKEHGAMGKVSEKDDTENNVLYGVRGHLYFVGSDLDVAEYASGYHSVGSGSSYALGAMAALEDLPPRDRITRALEIAAQYDIGTSAPFTIVDV